MPIVNLDNVSRIAAEFGEVMAFQGPGFEWSRPFIPAYDPATVAWFDLRDESTFETSGLEVISVGNKIAGSGVAMRNDSGIDRFSVGGSLNGGAAVEAYGDYMEITGLPTPMTLNIFVGGRYLNASGNGSFIGDLNNTYLPIGQPGSSNTNLIRIGGANDPAGVKLLFDGETEQSVTTRGQAFTKLNTSNLMSLIGAAYDYSFGLRLGRAAGGFDQDGVFSGVTIVAGAMTPEQIARHVSYYQRVDNW